MFKYATHKLTLALALVLLTAPVSRAVAATTDATPSAPPTATAPQTPTPDGVTGTDPEPTDPDVVGLILSLLHLA
jgi:hypothetical protein